MATKASTSTPRAPAKASRRAGGNAKATGKTVKCSALTARALEPSGGAYVRRLDLTGRCLGATPLTRAPVDLTGILASGSSLRALCDDLFRPFRESNVDLVVAVHDLSGAASHGFSAAIAGALAGRHNTAIGQVSVYRAPTTPSTEKTATVTAPLPRRAKKRGRTAAKTTATPAPADSSASAASADCHRVANVAHEPSGLRVEFRKELLAAAVAGTHVLLVCDWIDSADALIAVRDVLSAAGADVVGASVVVATSALLLEELASRHMVVSCAWTPTAGAQLTIRAQTDVVDVCCQCEAPSSAALSLVSSQQSPENELDFQAWTSQYEANAPSEDRSVNAVKSSDPAVRLHAVLDGHGGPFTVEYLKTTLCHAIFSRVTSESSVEQVEEALRETFAACDAALKTALECLPLDVRMSKGYCNSGACAVLALFVRSMLFVANVGDCVAVIGRRDPVSERVWARELSTEHNCRNTSEAKLVMERSRDRNAIRLSKDDQESENTFGVRRVAGSLAVTRAFGDFYLKCEDLSSAPFKSKVPYITVEPSICTFDLKAEAMDEQTLILASDGLWEVVGCEEAIKIAAQFESQQQAVFFASCSAALVHVALEKVAHRDGMLLHELLALPRGRERRRFHDDITCTVIRINSARPRLSSMDTLEETDATRVTDDDQSQSPHLP